MPCFDVVADYGEEMKNWSTEELEGRMEWFVCERFLILIHFTSFYHLTGGDSLIGHALLFVADFKVYNQALVVAGPWDVGE